MSDDQVTSGEKVEGREAARASARRMLPLAARATVLVGLIALVVVLGIGSLRRSNEIRNRTICASNLGGIGRGIKVYANDNDDWYPSARHVRMDPDYTGNQTEVAFVGRMSRNYWLSSNDSAVVASQGTSRSLFLLIINGTCTPKQFVCPNSGDVVDELREPGAPHPPRAASSGVNRFDFRGYPFIGYGYQLPFGNKAQPNESLDPRMPIMADKGPFFEADAMDPTRKNTPDKMCAGFSAGARIAVGGADGNAILKLPNEAWRKFNSRNHEGQGQEVLYQDGHADFEKRPIVGVNYDNIYTWQAGFAFEDSLTGNVPQDKRGPFTSTDSVIVP